MTLPSRFTKKVAIDPSGCWLWSAALSDGYGLYWHAGALVSAHRFAYEQVVGPIPDGRELDHECEVRRCVNPLHLTPVTHRRNLWRRFAKIVACPKGHPYDAENTTFVKRKGSNALNRRCVLCSRDRARDYARSERGKERQLARRRAAATTAEAAPSLFLP